MHTQIRSSVTSVPFLDLDPSHEGLKAGLLAEISGLIDSNSFTNGPQVAAFERAFAEYCGSEHGVGVASGLDALRLGLIAAGAQPGDEVIVPANTFAATLESIVQAGCRPVVVDVSENDLNIDVEEVTAAIGPRVRFLMPVHLYGQMADMSALRALAVRKGLHIVEDACQAHGASRDGLLAGSVGLVSAFSFYPGKNLGAFGDGGAVVTNDDDIAERVRQLREHGQTRKYQHDLMGWTSRLDTIQALVLLCKLDHLDEWNEQRRQAAAFYNSELAGVGDVQLHPVPAGSNPVWHLYVVRSRHRDALAEYLFERGIGTGLHYPEPVHLARAFESLAYRTGDFPVSERAARDVISLPLFPGITESQLNAVVVAVTEFYARGR